MHTHIHIHTDTQIIRKYVYIHFIHNYVSTLYIVKQLVYRYRYLSLCTYTHIYFLIVENESKKNDLKKEMLISVVRL